MSHNAQSITAVLVDDEQDASLLLTDLLSEYCPQVEVVATATSVYEAFELIEQRQPDLLFLDIQMPKKSGFDLLREIEQPAFQTIFVSAHESYAVEAVKFHAMAYLLKPVMAMDLVEAVKLAEKAIQEAALPQYDALMHHFQPDVPRRIAVPTGTGHRYFEMDEIIRVEASKSYSNIYTNQDKKPILVSRNLKQFDLLLAEQGFQRVHNGHLVNLRHIKAYLRQDGGGIVLSDGFEITIGRHYRKVVMEVLRSMTLIV